MKHSTNVIFLHAEMSTDANGMKKKWMFCGVQNTFDISVFYLQNHAVHGNSFCKAIKKSKCCKYEWSK